MASNDPRLETLTTPVLSHDVGNADRPNAEARGIKRFDPVSLSKPKAHAISHFHLPGGRPFQYALQISGVIHSETLDVVGPTHEHNLWFTVWIRFWKQSGWSIGLVGIPS